MLSYVKKIFLLSCCFTLGCAPTIYGTSYQVKRLPANKPVKTKVEKYSGLQVDVGLGRLISASSLQLGKNLDLSDQQMVGALAKETLDHATDNSTAVWNNPMTGHGGTLKILNTEGRPKEQLVCRQFSHTLAMDNKEEEVQGKACRDMWDPKKPWLLHQ